MNIERFQSYVKESQERNIEGFRDRLGRYQVREKKMRENFLNSIYGPENEENQELLENLED